MKISEVMELTSLTKKAINYYEKNGLISPSVNKENNYRDYTKEDIEKLKQISVLRNFDIPVKKIREILVNPKEMEKIFTEHLNKIKAEILNMERSKDIFQLCINDINFPNSDVGKVTNDMILLKRSLDMSEREKEGYMKKELIRIFPGFFGRYICLKYSNYIDEPIDSREKENAWIHLVKILDDSHELKVNKEILESMESDEIDWNLLEEIIRNRDKDFYSMNKEDIQNYVDNLYDAELTETDLKLLEQFISYASSKDNIKYMNDLLKLIDEDLKVLSLKGFMKNEIPLITFISQAHKIVKFPVLTLYSSDYKGTGELAVYNYMPVE